MFPYELYGNGAKVLEIGCGMGTMAMNWARNGAQVTAVDLNPVSIRETQRRFSLLGLNASSRLMDGNALALPTSTSTTCTAGESCTTHPICSGHSPR